MTNRRHRRCPPPLTALGLCLLPLSAAVAQPPAVALSWQAPRGCPTQREVERLFSRVNHAAGLDVLAEVERAGAGYRLRLRVQGEGQSFERELSAQSCAVLAESSLWLVELAVTQLSAASRGHVGEAESKPAVGSVRVSRERSVGDVGGASEQAVGVSGVSGEQAVGDDPDAQERTSAPDDASKSHPSDNVAVQDTSYLSAGVPSISHAAPAAAESGEGATRHGVHFRLGCGAAATDLGLSGLSPHLALDLTLALADWSVGLRLGAVFHPELSVADSAAVDLQTDTAQLLGCRFWDVAGAQIGPCLTLSGLHSVARTRGLTGGATSSASWLAAGPTLMLQLRLTRTVLVGVELGAWAALSPRPSFEVSDTSLARAGTLAGYARLGASYELW